MIKTDGKAILKLTWAYVGKNGDASPGRPQRRGEMGCGELLGIEKYHAEVLPQDKAEWVTSLQGEGKFVAMVGMDSLDVAPVLASEQYRHRPRRLD